MAYKFEFASTFDYTPILIEGIAVTTQLIVIGAGLGVMLGIACAWVRVFGSKALRVPVVAYMELIRNTPFLIQLFFIFFGLPAIGIKLSALEASALAMVINLGAYSAEIIRAGIENTPMGQFEASSSLAMTRMQVFRYIVLKPALMRVWPALSSQIVLVMLGSAVCSQVSANELTFAANFIQSRNFRAFEVYFVTTGIYLVLAILLRQALRGIGVWLFNGRAGR